MDVQSNCRPAAAPFHGASLTKEQISLGQGFAVASTVGMTMTYYFSTMVTTGSPQDLTWMCQSQGWEN